MDLLLNGDYHTLGGRSGQIYDIFDIFGGAVDTNNSMSMLKYVFALIHTQRMFPALGSGFGLLLVAQRPLNPRFLLQFWRSSKHLPHSLVEIPTTSNKKSYSNTATTNKDLRKCNIFPYRSNNITAIGWPWYIYLLILKYYLLSYSQQHCWAGPLFRRLHLPKVHGAICPKEIQPLAC